MYLSVCLSVRAWEENRYHSGDHWKIADQSDTKSAKKGREAAGAA